MTQTITSLVGYTRKIRAMTASDDELLVYRGHSDRVKYQLLPSVLREPRFVDAEHHMLRELIATHPREFSEDKTTLEHLARAQHYSLPTRLLDLTWNPLVGLFFACNKHQDKPAEVIVLRVKKSILKFFDSDTVSCLSNLAYLSPMERNAIDFSLSGNAFNRQKPIDRLLQFVRAEKPYFRPEIISSDLQGVVCVKPKQSSRRIVVQSGAFLLWGLFGNLDDNTVPGITVERIYVNGKRKRDICDELDRMAISDSSMFPGVEQAAWYLKNKA